MFTVNTYMGIDLGTSGVKALIINENGDVLGKGYCELNVSTPNPLWAEQAPEDWWKATCVAVKSAVGGDSILGKSVKGIGLTGQMLGATFLGKDLKPLMPSIIWLDQRAYKENEYIREKIGMKKLLDITANVPLTGYFAQKILWLRNNREDIYNKVEKIVFPKDYLRLKMTGEIAMEVSDVSGSYLYDVKKREWSKELFDTLEIPMSFFPKKVYESHEITGVLLKNVADDLGLTAGIPIVAGGGDQTAGGIGNGVVREGVVSSSLGSSGVVFASVDSPYVDSKDRAALSFCHSVENKWCFFGCTMSAGGSYKWLRDNFAFNEMATAKKHGVDPYVLMNEQAEKVSIGSEGLIFLPYLNGERTPYPDPDARGVFYGLSLRHGWPEMVRSVMEGITFSLRDTVEILREFDIDVKQVRASGGGAKSELWRQIQADIFNAEVVTLNLEEGPSAGAAILAAVGTGAYKNVIEATDRMLRPVTSCEPKKENVAIYEDLYGIYKSLYPALKDTYKQHSKFLKKWY